MATQGYIDIKSNMIVLLKGSDKQNYMLGCLLIQVSHITNSDIWGKLIIASITKTKRYHNIQPAGILSTCLKCSFQQKGMFGFQAIKLNQIIRL